QVGGTRVPTGRMNDGGIDAAFVHQKDGLLRGKGRDLAMREIAREAGSPEVNLGVDDLHRMLPFIFAHRTEHPDARAGMLMAKRSAVSCRCRWHRVPLYSDLTAGRLGASRLGASRRRPSPIGNNTFDSLPWAHHD